MAVAVAVFVVSEPTTDTAWDPGILRNWRLQHLTSSLPAADIRFTDVVKNASTCKGAPKSSDTTSGLDFRA